MTPARILIVEDDPAAAQYLALALADEGCSLRSVHNGVEALLAIESERPDLVISDLRMPEMNGLALLSRIKQRWPELHFILVTVEQDIATVVEAVQLGALNYLVKPVSLAALRGAVRRALSARVGSPAAGDLAPEIVGSSKGIVEVRHQVALAARNDVNVLVAGKTGTGKELVARAIHRCSAETPGPLVAHNCAATPPDLFESQFFGHRRGAFTGAARDHLGLLERADGGVLLLDELESLSLPHQAKLLRVLDDGDVRPVGAADVRHVSVRFIATTNHDPREMIDTGVLREDLYYRLRGFEICLPTLRERRDDVPLLVSHFLGERAGEIKPDALAELRDRTWPGNVRELRNAVRSADALAAPGPIGVEHLSLEQTPRAQEISAQALLRGGATLKDVERDAIATALRRCGGNRTRAARLLGIDRSTLRRKLAALGLEDASTD